MERAPFKRWNTTGVLSPLHFRVQFWSDFVSFGEFWPYSGDSCGCSVTVGAEISFPPVAHTDACRIRGSAGTDPATRRNWEYAGWENKFGGAANFFADRTHLWGLFWHFFHSKLQTDGYFAVQGYLGVS
jgi:hypothetical protein